MPRKQRVLAVDDHPRNLAILERALGEDYELLTVSSGEAALDVAARFRPDAILLDVMMPGLDGYETAKRLRGITALRDAKIIMVSARAQTADRLQGYAAGADDYITKPFDSEELLAKLRVLVKLKSVEEVDRLKGDLLHLISHETRTPLSSILAPCDLLLEAGSLSPAQAEMVEMIRRGGQRLLSLVERVAYLNQLRAGLLSEFPTSLPLDALFERLRATWAPAVAAKDVRFETECGSGLSVWGDAHQLERALAVLLENGLRVSPAGGTLRLEAADSPTGIWLRVSDQGPGIPESFRGQLFEEFSVADIQHHSRGHGLGLATARVIAERHGGELRVERTGPTGTCFALRLPRPQAQAEAA